MPVDDQLGTRHTARSCRCEEEHWYANSEAAVKVSTSARPDVISWIGERRRASARPIRRPSPRCLTCVTQDQFFDQFGAHAASWA
jgi:hypothetical protein